VTPSAPWHHAPPITADVGEGFVATEAPAMQQSIRSALRTGEGKQSPMVVEVQFTTGAAARVVVEWRNRNVGFVPTSHLASLRGQLTAAGKAVLWAPGCVFFDGTYWRVWVGAEPADGFPEVAAGYDELPEPPTAIFGFPLSRLRRDV
jgi:hypothetical protein